MTKTATLLAALALATIPALAQPVGTKADPKAVKKEDSMTVTAVVESIDYKTREVTLDSPKGKFTLAVSEDAKNFDKVKKGDSFTVTYREGILAEVRTPTAEEKAQPYQESATGGVGGPAKPGVTAGYKTKAVLTVLAIDKEHGTVTFKGPRGKTETVRAEDPKNLDKIEVGDTVVVTYTEAVALSFQPAPPPKK